MGFLERGHHKLLGPRTLGACTAPHVGTVSLGLPDTIPDAVVPAGVDTNIHLARSSSHAVLHEITLRPVVLVLFTGNGGITCAWVVQQLCRVGCAEASGGPLQAVRAFLPPPGAAAPSAACLPQPTCQSCSPASFMTYAVHLHLMLCPATRTCGRHVQYYCSSNVSGNSMFCDVEQHALACAVSIR